MLIVVTRVLINVAMVVKALLVLIVIEIALVKDCSLLNNISSAHGYPF